MNDSLPASGQPQIEAEAGIDSKVVGKQNVTEAERRKARLAAQLRANLARRKNQSRARRQGEGDGRKDGLPAAAGSDEADGAKDPD